MTSQEKLKFAEEIVREAGAKGLAYFKALETVKVEMKGHQDFVSQADRNLEQFVRQELQKAFPEDSIVGEEYPPYMGTSGFVWVIDPIDGTTNFVNGIPAWTVLLAGVANKKTEIGVVHDPCGDETWCALRGKGAWLNGQLMKPLAHSEFTAGTISVGYSNRVGVEGIKGLVDGIIEEGGLFSRNAAAALSIAYVASGRLLGYAEEHMNSWDCLAAQLIVKEAGGRIEDQDADEMIAVGGRVVVAAPGVFEKLVEIADRSFGQNKMKSAT